MVTMSSLNILTFDCVIFPTRPTDSWLIIKVPGGPRFLRINSRSCLDPGEPEIDLVKSERVSVIESLL